MSRYLVCIELNKIGGGDAQPLYQSLDQHMREAGFVRTVSGKAGLSQLPHGLYLLESSGNIDSALLAGSTAAAKTGHFAEIFCCLYVDWASRNLPALMQ